MSVTRIRQRAVVVLVAFVAALGLMVLAPFVHPVADELLCSADHHAVAMDDDGGMPDGMSPAHGMHDHGDHAAHCPLCVAVGAPPSSLVLWDGSSVPPLDHVLRATPATLSASLVGAPFPARGPPFVS